MLDPTTTMLTNGLVCAALISLLIWPEVNGEVATWTSDDASAMLHHSNMDEDTSKDPTIQDDEIEIMLHSMRNQSCFHCPIDQKLAHKLTKNSMEEMLKQKNVFAVMFWLNVETVSRAVLHMTINMSTILAKDLSGSMVGTVACHDWPDVCDKYHVITWPRLLFFRNGQVYKEYKGVWDMRAMINWIKMLSGPSLRRLTSADQIEQFSKGTGLDLMPAETVAPAVTLIALQSEDEESPEAQTVSAVSDQLHGRYFLAIAMQKASKKWIEQLKLPHKFPLVVTFKPQDQFEPLRVLSSNEFSVDILMKFIIQSSRPTVKKITDTSFPALYQEKKPFLIALGNGITSSELYQHLGAVAKDKSVDSLVSVTFVEINQSRNLAKKIIKLLKLTWDRFPLLILSNPDKGTLHLYQDLASSTAESIKRWVLNVADGSQQPAAYLDTKDWKTRPLMYDYKGFIYGEDSLRYNDWLKKQAETKDQPKSQSHRHDEF